MLTRRSDNLLKLEHITQNQSRWITKTGHSKYSFALGAQ